MSPRRSLSLLGLLALILAPALACNLPQRGEPAFPTAAFPSATPTLDLLGLASPTQPGAGHFHAGAARHHRDAAATHAHALPLLEPADGDPGARAAGPVVHARAGGVPAAAHLLRPAGRHAGGAGGALRRAPRADQPAPARGQPAGAWPAAEHPRPARPRPLPQRGAARQPGGLLAGRGGLRHPGLHRPGWRLPEQLQRDGGAG